MKTIDDTLAEKLGKTLAELLNLPLKKNGRYDTAWGDKTPIGLFRSVERVVNNDLPE